MVSASHSTIIDLRRVSVVVPVYNAEATLEELTTRLVRVLESTVSDFELVFVDDGSRDQSRAVLDRLAHQDRRVRSVGLMRNYGQHNALLCGIRLARYELIVTLDDDLQNPPEEIPSLIGKLDEGFDVVYGAARERPHDGWRAVASWLTRIALHGALGAETARWVSPYRLFRASLREAFAAYESSFVSIDVLLSWATTRFAAVPVVHHPRRVGVSNYSGRALVVLAINMVTGFSTVPLQIATLFGFLATLLGIGLLGYVLTRYALQGSPVPGFPFLASITLVFSGTQLFALGIIGEYLARMHFRMLGRPAYAQRPALDPSYPDAAMAAVAGRSSS